MNPSTQIPPHYPRPGYPPLQRRDGPGYALQIIQQPERGKVVIKGKDKDRKPIDPPPILQLHANSVDNPCPYWFNPYLFCTVTLFDASEDRPKEQDDDRLPTLVGASASSLHRLKDLTNTEGAFFVFGDLAATVVGKARLHFNLFELEPHTGHAVMVQATTSHVFDIQVPRDWEGVKESTILSRTFSDQGVKLRLRKESRAAQRRRSFHPQPAMPTMPQPPLRPHPSIHGGYHDTQPPLRTQPPGQGGYNDPQHNIRPHSSTQGSFDDNADEDLDERDSKRPRTYATSNALNYPGQTTAAAYGQSGQHGSYGGVATPEQGSYSNGPPVSGYGSTASPIYATSYSHNQPHPSYGPPQTSYGQPPAHYTPGYQQYPQGGYAQPYGPGAQYAATPPGPGGYGSNQYPNYSQGMGYGGYGAPSGQQWSPDHYNQQNGALPGRSGYPSAASGAPTLPPTSSIASSQPSHLSTSMQTNRLPPLANLPSISAPLAQNQSLATSGHTSPHAQQPGSGSGLPYPEA